MKIRKSSVKKPSHKKSNSVANGETGANQVAEILEPLNEEEKTEDQKEMDRYLAPILYQTENGQSVEIRNFEDIA